MGRCPHRPADLPEDSNFLGQPHQNRPAEFARCPRCPPGACQRRLLPLPVSVMLIFGCFLVQVGDFYFFTALANKPPLKGVTPHGVGRCPQGRGNRSVRGEPPLGGGGVPPQSVTSSAAMSKPSGGIRSLPSLFAWGLPTPVVAFSCIGNVDIRLFFLCKWVTLFHTAFASLSVYRLSYTTDFTRSYASFFLY